MDDGFPESWATLQWPWVRRELLCNLEDLSVSDPRRAWRRDMAYNLASGIDEVFHFFFDDHDFEQEIGMSLFEHRELEAINDLKSVLDAILFDLPNGDDDAFVDHPRWKEVTDLSGRALKRLQTR